MGSTKNENETQGTSKPVTKSYGKIVLTLQNCLLPEEKLSQTPSQVDGLDNETETDLRIWGCELIQTAGILLKLPQVAMATGQVIFQRFYYCKSLVRHSVETTAMGCVCLASKIEEAPRRIRDVINVFHHIKQVNGGKTIQPMVLDQSYIALKNQVIKAERRVLKELGFCVHIKHPHKLIVMYLRILGLDKHKTLVQIAWNYMNDSLRTDIFLRYQPEIVACACIYLTARKLKMPLPKTPSWFTLFGATEADIREICLRILRLYSRPKPNVDELEKKVEELKKVYEDSRIKSRAANHLAGDSANSPSDSNSPRNKEKTGGSHNAWGGFISRSGSHAVSNSDNKNRSRSRSESLSPNSKHRSSKHHKKHSRKTSRSRSRSRTRSRSPSKSRKHKTRKNNRDKSRYRSRSRSHDRRSNSYDRNDKYDKIDSKSEKYDKSNEKYDRYLDKSNKYREKSLDRNDKYSDKDRYKDEKYLDKYRDKSVDRSDKYLKDIDKYSSKERIKDRSNSLDRIESKYDTKKERYSDSKFKDDKYISREDKYSNDKDRYSKRDKRSRDDVDKERERDRDIREKSSKDRRR